MHAAIDADGHRLLHWAQRADVVRVLLAAGASVNAGADGSGDVPLHAVARTSTVHAGTVEALVEGGADLNATSRAGRTALHDAVERCLRDSNPDAAAGLAQLLALGADPTVSADGQASPLAFALQRLDAGVPNVKPEAAASHLAIIMLLTQAAARQRRRHVLVSVGDTGAAAIGLVRAAVVRWDAARADLAAARSTKSAAAAERVCNELAALAADDGVFVPLTAAGCIGQLVDQLAIHADTPIVAAALWATVGSLACGENVTSLMVAAGVIVKLVDALAVHAVSQQVAEAACGVIAEMAGDTGCASALTAAGVIPALIAVLQAHVE